MDSVSGSTGWECAQSSTNGLQRAIFEAMPERDGNKEALEQVEKATDIEPGSDRS